LEPISSNMCRTSSLAPPCKGRKERGGGGGGEKGVALRTADGAHGVGAAVLLVVGVQDKEDVESARDHRIGEILRLDHLPQHIMKFSG